MNRIPRGLAHEIESSIKEDVEIECKIRLETMNRDIFHSLIKKLSSNSEGKWKKIESHTIDIYRKEKRFTKIGRDYFNTSKSAPVVLRVIEFEDEGFDLKFTVSKEKMTQTKEPKTYDFKRIKDRTSFVNGNITIDLTVITHEDDEDNETPQSYEVEVEVINSLKFNASLFYNTIFMVVDLVRDPGKILIPYFNKSLNFGRVEKNDQLDRSGVARPRDLRFEDITNNGLLQHYAISVKIDGEPKFMVFHPTIGIWFIQFSRDKSRIFEKIGDISGFEHLKDTIFAGEVVDKKYYPFDCVMYKGKRVFNQDFIMRRKYTEEINGKRIAGYNIILLQIFKYQSRSEDFYKAVREAFQEEATLDVSTDGLVFNPIYSDYVPLGQYQQKKDRILSKYPDICKYKLPENRTIDFEVKEGILYSAGGILFQGSEKYPFNDKNYTLDMDDLEGNIVEFSPVLHPSGEKITYKPIRIRYDKDYPNSHEVAIENWESQYDPIYPSTLMGKDTRLYTRYLTLLIKKMRKNMEGYVIDFTQPGDEGRLGDEEYTDKVIRKIVFSSLKDIKDFLPLHPTEDLNINLFHKVDIEMVRKIIDAYNARKGEGKILINYLLPSPVEKVFEILHFHSLYQEHGSGKETDAPIMSDMEKELARHHVYGTAYYFEGKEKIIRVPVDINKVIQNNKGYVAFGDDKHVEYINDLTRIGSNDEGKSLLHSLLKLLNHEYRSSGVKKRIDMVNRAFPTFGNLDLHELSDKLKHSIYVYSENGKVEKIGDNDRVVMLLKHNDGSYEPLVRKNKDGSIDLVFSR